MSNRISGGYSPGDPPLPIPNRAVKPGRADGTALKCGRVGRRRFLSEANSGRSPEEATRESVLRKSRRKSAGRFIMSLCACAGRASSKVSQWQSSHSESGDIRLYARHAVFQGLRTILPYKINLHLDDNLFSVAIIRRGWSRSPLHAHFLLGEGVAGVIL